MWPVTSEHGGKGDHGPVWKSMYSASSTQLTTGLACTMSITWEYMEHGGRLPANYALTVYYLPVRLSETGTYYTHLTGFYEDDMSPWVLASINIQRVTPFTPYLPIYSTICTSTDPNLSTLPPGWIHPVTWHSTERLMTTVQEGGVVAGGATVLVNTTFPGRAPALASEVCTYQTGAANVGGGVGSKQEN
jgi:hypothetical protein